jgi:hypothetical protein
VMEADSLSVVVGDCATGKPVDFCEQAGFGFTSLITTLKTG